MISREELLTQLRARPSSLNDACRMMEMAADFITRHAQCALPTHVEKTEAGTINWKMEVERLNRLLAKAQGAPNVETMKLPESADTSLCVTSTEGCQNG